MTFASSPSRPAVFLRSGAGDAGAGAVPTGAATARAAAASSAAAIRYLSNRAAARPKTSVRILRSEIPGELDVRSAQTEAPHQRGVVALVVAHVAPVDVQLAPIEGVADAERRVGGPQAAASADVDV